MKFTLKRFQSFRSHDGGGFNFDLYIDGKKAAEVSDEGHGGGLLVRWEKGDFEKQFEAHVAALPPEPLAADAAKWEHELYPSGFSTMDGDTYLCSLVDAYENNKRLARHCKNKTVFRIPSDAKGNYRTLSVPFNEASKAKVLAKYPEATFLNEAIAETSTR